MTLGDWLSILIDFIFTPRKRIVKFGDAVYFLGTRGIYRYGPDGDGIEKVSEGTK